MAGWNLKSGSITEYNLSEERIWELFNFVFSDSSKKRNTYKFGLIKAEFEKQNCFYCGKKLGKNIHVDHFIPWSFVKDDKVWNFVLSCSTCNEKKNNRVPDKGYIEIINNRNRKLMVINNDIVQSDFRSYYDGVVDCMWQYAKASGLKEYHPS